MDQEFKFLCEKLKPLFNESRGICSPANDRLIAKLSELIDINVIRVKSGEKLEDWTVPNAWELIDSYAKVGDKIYTKDNCKLMVPFGSDSWEYQGDLLSIKSQIVTDYSKYGITPYRTSYYNDDKPVICLPPESLIGMSDDTKVKILVKTTRKSHYMSIGEAVIPGETSRTILLSTYNCHPGLGNDNFSGILAWIYLLQKVSAMRNNHYTYRFVIAPETIGSIAYIKHLTDNNQLINTLHTFVLTCLGGQQSNYTYKDSQYKNGYSRFLVNAIRRDYPEIKVRHFSHDGSDERQYSSPGVRKSTSSLCRNRYYEYSQYHSSADDWEYMNQESVYHSCKIIYELIQEADIEVRVPCTNFKYGEPSLSSLGISFHSGGGSIKNSGEYKGVKKRDFFDVLSLCNGELSIDEITEILNKDSIEDRKVIELIHYMMKMNVVRL